MDLNTNFWGVSGIYCIYNKVNGKKYIGSAVNLPSRKSVHFSSLKKNKHHSKYLQRAFNKYGIDAFEFAVIDTVDKDDLIKMEQQYIDFLKPEYNILKIAYSSFGFKHSKDTIDFLKTFNKNMSNDKEWRDKVSVGWFKKGGKISKEEKEKLRKRMLINNPYKGKKHTAEIRKKMSEKAKQRDRSVYNLSGLALGAEASKKKVIQLSMDDEYIAKFDSITDAAISVGGKKPDRLSLVCKGKKKQYLGFKWRFADEKRY